jgi:hypothetical protein
MGNDPISCDFSVRICRTQRFAHAAFCMVISSGNDGWLMTGWELYFPMYGELWHFIIPLWEPHWLTIFGGMNIHKQMVVNSAEILL